MKAALFIACLSVLAAAQEAPKPLTSCELVAGRKEYDKKIVTVSGYVDASYHVTLLTNPDCKATITLADSNLLPKDPLYIAYNDGVQAMRLKNENQKFQVVVEGRFNSALLWHGLKGNQLVITRILDTKVEGIP
jgi:hypothetical protein